MQAKLLSALAEGHLTRLTSNAFRRILDPGCRAGTIDSPRCLGWQMPDATVKPWCIMAAAACALGCTPTATPTRGTPQPEASASSVAGQMDDAPAAVSSGLAAVLPSPPAMREEPHERYGRQYARAVRNSYACMFWVLGVVQCPGPPLFHHLGRWSGKRGTLNLYWRARPPRPGARGLVEPGTKVRGTDMVVHRWQSDGVFLYIAIRGFVLEGYATSERQNEKPLRRDLIEWAKRVNAAVDPERRPRPGPR